VVVATAAVEAREVMAVHAVVEAAVRARLRCPAVAAEEDNERAEAATVLATELVWCHKVAVADLAVRAAGAIDPAGISVHDPGELRAVPPLYLETSAGDGPVARVVDRAATSGLHLEIDLEEEAVIVRTPATVRDSGAATSLGRAIVPA
jgi:hypothetical protein